ncbi:MAG: hypothetical protein WBW71_14525 [Bacteroidota bacterium]
MTVLRVCYHCCCHYTAQNSICSEGIIEISDESTKTKDEMQRGFGIMAKKESGVKD